MLRGLVLTAVLLLSACGSPEQSPAAPTSTTPAKRLLVVTYTTGFRHDSIAIAEQTLDALARQAGTFTVQFCRTGADVQSMLSPASLRGFDAVAFVNTTGNLGLPDLPAFLGWIAEGPGFAGMHSAADTYHDEPAYLDMLGNEFLTHGAESSVDAMVENPTHPASAMLGPRFAIFDEIYRFARGNRGQVTMLMSLDRQPVDGLPGQGEPADLPLAWAKAHGAGRVFYTALGHRDDVWSNGSYRQHIGAGLQWVLGLP